MKKKVIGLGLLVLVAVSIYVGMKNGAISKIIRQMPKVSTDGGYGNSRGSNGNEGNRGNGGTGISGNAGSNGNNGNTSDGSNNGRPQPYTVDMYMTEAEKKNLDPQKKWGGQDVVNAGEEFIVTGKNIKNMDVIYELSVRNCQISRECNFDYGYVNWILEEEKKYQDENHNFESKYYYLTADIDVTCIKNETNFKDMHTHWSLYSLNENGTYYVTRDSHGEPVGGTVGGHGNVELNVGESTSYKNIYVVSDEALNNNLAIWFGTLGSAYIGPWVLVHEVNGE